ncbi:MAG: reverse transcriptase/maturase family protein [Patescibacteria group bacterium]
MFEQIVSLENLLLAFREFRRGKQSKPDVQLFEFNLEDNLWQIHRELVSGLYINDPYSSFYIADPKLRHIHKASVRDRVVHQAIFRVLYSVFDLSFIHDSYSCRVDKGTHRAVLRLDHFLNQVSKNNTQPTYALKCDIKKFFDSIDQAILLKLIKNKIGDERLFSLVNKIINSFSVGYGKGLPLGNVTSQLFSNIYLNELDQFVKHKLKIKYYLRYCDDFVIVNNNQKYLENLISKLAKFLGEKLQITLHERKIIIRKFNQGVDFLGYVVLPHYRVLRTKTKRRVMRKLRRCIVEFKTGQKSVVSVEQSFQSYLGILKHCRGYKISQQILELGKW